MLVEVRKAFVKLEPKHGAKLVSRPLFFPNEVCPASLKPRWKLGSSKACGIVGLSVPKREEVANLGSILSLVDIQCPACGCHGDTAE